MQLYTFLHMRRAFAIDILEQQLHQNRAPVLAGFDASFWRRRLEEHERDLQVINPDLPEGLTLNFIRCSFEENAVGPPAGFLATSGIITGLYPDNRFVIRDSFFLGNQYNQPNINVSACFFIVLHCYIRCLKIASYLVSSFNVILSKTKTAARIRRYWSRRYHYYKYNVHQQ
jgi:hypothetical protein